MYELRGKGCKFSLKSGCLYRYFSKSSSLCWTKFALPKSILNYFHFTSRSFISVKIWNSLDFLSLAFTLLSSDPKVISFALCYSDQLCNYLLKYLLRWFLNSIFSKDQILPYSLPKLFIWFEIFYYRAHSRYFLFHSTWYYVKIYNLALNLSSLDCWFVSLFIYQNFSIQRYVKETISLTYDLASF